ncbi:MAG: type II secretion system F family protein, partial [Pelovirga sp.]
MPLYRYKIRDAQGNTHQGESEATSAEALASLFQAQQAIPIDIVEIPARASLSLGKIFKFRLDAGVSLDDLNLYCRQMYTLINAGVPLIKALRGLVATTRNPSLAKALNEVVEDLESGMELSGCYSRHPQVFPALLCHMVQVGEVTGKLDQVFIQLAVYFEREKDTINRIKSALRYPTFVVVAILFAIIFVSLFVIPAFERVFASAGSDLPLATRILMGLSAFMQNYWPLLLLGAVVMFFVVRRVLKTTRGRYLWDQYKLNIPLVGSILLRATLVRFSRGFNMSYTAGVPLSQALGLTARAVNNVYVGEKIEMIRNGIERG